MFCKQCGKELNDDASFCTNCGANLSRSENANAYGQNSFGGPVNEPQNNSYQQPGQGVSPDDRGGFLWGLLGYIAGIIGLILYFVWREQYPKRSKSILIGFIVSIVLGAVVSIITFVFFGDVIMRLIQEYYVP